MEALIVIVVILYAVLAAGPMFFDIYNHYKSGDDDEDKDSKGDKN